MTKLFQSRDIGLRRMVYLMIKEISPSADEVKHVNGHDFPLSLTFACSKMELTFARVGAGRLLS